MGRYSEQELKFAIPLAQGLISDPDFRVWFTGRAQLRTATHDPDGQRRLRSPTMKNPYGFNYWCGKDSRCACRIGTSIETDILLIFSEEDASRTAVHIEVKRPGDRLSAGQAASYPRRAACWQAPATRPRTVPAHDRTLLVLAHGWPDASADEAACFDRLHPHEQIAAHLPFYPLP